MRPTRGNSRHHRSGRRSASGCNIHRSKSDHAHKSSHRYKLSKAMKSSHKRSSLKSSSDIRKLKSKKNHTMSAAKLQKLKKSILNSKNLYSSFSLHSHRNGNNNSKVRKDKKPISKSKGDGGHPGASGLNNKSNKKLKRSRSKTRFSHVKSKSKTFQEASGSGPFLPKSGLKYDIEEHSLSTMKALESPKNLCHVEVCAFPKSNAKVRELKTRIKVLLKKRNVRDVTIPFNTDNYLRDHVQSINIIPPKTEDKKNTAADTRYQVHVYQSNDCKYITGDWEEEDTVTAKHWLLPNDEFNGLWESLIFDTPVKDQVLNYAMTMLMYSDKNIDKNIICCNRVVLLHGPPGTGKTTLCRAMAQKLCIRLSYKYRHGQLVEINSQGLFSKYFSESGKLVGKMFDKIQEFIDKKDSLVCILIDEVESLANNRKNMMNGNEPSDSMRVVNALLTRLDDVKRHSNVIVFTTTNVTKAIEAAFLDRADIKKYIGVPNAEAIYSVYRGCIHESMRAGIITPELTLLRWVQLDGRKGVTSSDPTVRHSLKLKNLSMASIGLSGRSLRKLPMLFHAEYLPAQKLELNAAFWEAMHHCIQNQFKEAKRLNRDPEI